MTGKDVVIRPSFQTWRNRFVSALVVVGVFVVIRLWGDWHRVPIVARDLEAILFASSIVFAGLVILLVFTREELVIAGGTLTRRNLLGIPTRYPLDRIGGMARRDVTYLFARQPSQYIVVYDKQNRCLFKMNRVIWDPGDVRRLHAIVGGDGRTRLSTMSELAEEFPGSIAWPIAHPWATFAIEFAVLLVLLFALVSLQDAVTSRL